MRATSIIVIAASLLAGCGTTPHRTPLAGDAVAPDVSLLRGTFVPGAQPDGNSVLLRGRDGPIVVDSGRHAAHTAGIVDAARAAGLPIVAIVNTHWHFDHVAGNAALREAYPQAEVFASDAIHDALEGFLADYRAQLAQMPDTGEAASEQVAGGWRAEIARIASCRAGWLRDANALISPQDMGLVTTLLDYYLGQVLRAPRERKQKYRRAGTGT